MDPADLKKKGNVDDSRYRKLIFGFRPLSFYQRSRKETGAMMKIGDRVRDKATGKIYII